MSLLFVLKTRSATRRLESSAQDPQAPPHPTSPTPNGTTPTLQARSISSHRLCFTPRRCATASRVFGDD